MYKQISSNSFKNEITDKLFMVWLGLFGIMAYQPLQVI